MDKKKRNTLFLIVRVGLAAAGIVFLLVAIFGEDELNWVLASALFCIVLSNVLNIVCIQRNNKK